MKTVRQIHRHRRAEFEKNAMRFEDMNMDDDFNQVIMENFLVSLFLFLFPGKITKKCDNVSYVLRWMEEDSRAISNGTNLDFNSCMQENIPERAFPNSLHIWEIFKAPDGTPRLMCVLCLQRYRR